MANIIRLTQSGADRQTQFDSTRIVQGETSEITSSGSYYGGGKPVYTIELYNLDIRSSTFTRTAIIDTFYGLQFFTKLNGVGGCVFNLNLFDPNARTNILQRFRTQIAIKRNGTIIWVGPIVKVSGEVFQDQYLVNVEALSYLAHLRTRYTAEIKRYTNTDAGAIAWDLIDTVQSRTNGELLISQNNIEATVNRDRTYEYKAVADAIIDLSNVINGFDFELAPTQDANGLLNGINFNVVASMGRVRNDLPTLNIGNEIISMSFATQDIIINDIIGDGADTGSGALTVTADNSDSQIAYSRKEEIYIRPDISVESTLQQTVDDRIETLKDERFDISIQLSPNVFGYGSFMLGDTLNVDIQTEPASYLNLEGTAKVKEIAVSLDEAGAEFITPKVDFEL